jgi:hypothetical protein
LLAVCGLALAGLMLVARNLTPSPRGFGTHEQLGLPPCTFLTATGRRCPSCGMTTSLAHLTRGQWSKALRSNVAGVLVGLASFASAPWCLLSAAVGRPVGVRSIRPVLACIVALVALVSVGGWILRLLFSAA